jgi:uncharacterized protein YndB with AHSA1/START domain
MTAIDVVTATVSIQASPEVVFEYFTDPALMIEWIGDYAELTPEPGGVFAIDFGAVPMRGTYLELDPPNRVVFTWGIAGNDVLPAGSSTVEVVLRADGADTIVELFHRGLPSDEERSKHQAGWVECLARLVTAAGGSPT